MPPFTNRKVNKKWRHIFLSAFLQLDKSDNEDGVYVASGSANIILYVGLGMICIGLVITFVGLGDKGFRTLELKLIGPSLVGCGVFFALLRVLFCTVPSCCRACCKCCGKTDDKEELIYATVSVFFISMERSILVKKKAKKLEIRFIIQIPWKIRTSNLLVNTKIRESLFIYN